MTTLKALSLGNLIRSQIRPNDTLFTPLTTTSEDMKNIWQFLKTYEGMFINTPFGVNIDINDGLDGRSLYANHKAISGFLYDTNELRPKTISESLTELYRTIDVKILNSDVSTELAEIKDVIGLANFYDGMPSSDGSVDTRISDIIVMLDQLAADIFNRGTGIGDVQDDQIYSYNDDGKQTQADSIKDLLMKVIDAHGGLNKVNHEHITSRHVWGLSIPNDISVLGGTDVLTTVFATGNIFDEYVSAQRYYNPFSNDITIRSAALVVLENTLGSVASVTVYVNGAPTGLDIKLLSGNVGQFKNDLVDVVLGPDDYMQFKVSAGSIPSGYLKISNLSVIIEENN